jgi:hypothetical protein
MKSLHRQWVIDIALKLLGLDTKLSILIRASREQLTLIVQKKHVLIAKSDVLDFAWQVHFLWDSLLHVYK